MINPDFFYINKKQLYDCKLKIDGKIIDKMETDDYEVWYDKITDEIYELNGFMKIEIKIHFCNTLKSILQIQKKLDRNKLK